MIIAIIINNNQYHFDKDWKNSDLKNWEKESYGFGLLGIRLEFLNDMYRLWFYGHEFMYLAKIHDKFYGLPRKKYSSVEEAKNHVDNFLKQYNRLISFI